MTPTASSPGSARTAPASFARRLRRRLGRLKCKLLDEWPYLPLVRRARRLRRQQGPILLHLPKICFRAGPECEVHMLCGHRDADMGMWASWSLLRFLPSAELVVHSDGTLSPEDRALWGALIERVSFTTPREREARAEELRTAFPAVHKWRTVHGCGAKFVDFHLFGRSRRLLLLDSDVLCFSEPRDLLAALALPQPAMRWNEDLTTSYAASPAELSALLGFAVPAKVNSGFLFTKRWTRADFAFLDGMLDTLLRHGVPIYEWWAEQMLYATGAARHATAQPFSSDYAVKLGGTAPSAIVRHYVGVPRIRPRFQTEGVPRLLAQLHLSPAAYRPVRIRFAEPPRPQPAPVSHDAA